MDTIKGRKRTRRRRCQTGILAADITKEMLEQWFHLPSHEACSQLGISLSVLKRVCRKLGIPRWPYRTLTQNWSQEQQLASDAAGVSASQLSQPPTPPSGSTAAETDSQPSGTEAPRSASAPMKSAMASIARSGQGAAARGSLPSQQQQQQRADSGPSSLPSSMQQKVQQSQQPQQAAQQHAEGRGGADQPPAVKAPQTLETLLALVGGAAVAAPPQPAAAGPSCGSKAPPLGLGCGSSPGVQQQSAWLPADSRRWGERTDDAQTDLPFTSSSVPQAVPKQGHMAESSGWEAVPGLQPAARRFGALLEPPSPLQKIEPLPQLPSVSLPLQRQQQQQHYQSQHAQQEPRAEGPAWGSGEAPATGPLGFQQLAARLVQEFMQQHPVAHACTPSVPSPAAAAAAEAAGEAAMGAYGAERYRAHAAVDVGTTAGGGVEPQPARAALLSLLGLLRAHESQREVQPAPCSPRQAPEQAQHGLTGWSQQGIMQSVPSAGGVAEEGQLGGAGADWQRRPDQRYQRYWQERPPPGPQQEASWSMPGAAVSQQGQQLPRAAALAELILRRQRLQQQEEEEEEGVWAPAPAPGHPAVQVVMPAWDHRMQEQQQVQQARSLGPPHGLLGCGLEVFPDQADYPLPGPPLTERLYAVLRGLASNLQQEAQQAQQPQQAPMPAAGPSLRPAQPVQAQHAYHAERAGQAGDDFRAQHAQHVLTQQLQHAQRQQGATEAAWEMAAGAPQANRLLQALLHTLGGR